MTQGAGEVAHSERDRAIADFFKVLTELAKLCHPLVKKAVDAETTKGRRG